MRSRKRGARAWVPLLVLTSVPVLGAACSDSSSESSSRTPAHSGAPSTAARPSATPKLATASSSSTTTTATTTSAPLSAANYLVEPCANIVGSPPPTSNLDLRPFLLGAAQLPAGAVIDGPHQTSNTAAKVYASVPTTSPAAYENITLRTATKSGGTAYLGLSEVIGDVGSASFAGQWLSMLDARC